ncbi:MAG: formate/nitrite transporter family protein, partial [Clostridia bacterium]|nr:formate/nitrite transporter family protein [Clostridia bacterium]
MKKLAVFLRAIAAGVMISIGGAVYLSCDNKYVGALAFCVGLISVVLFKMELYTGKVGYIVTEKPSFIIDTLISIPGNFLGCAIVGLICPPFGSAEAVCASKLAKAPLRVFVDAFLCGLLIYVCVEIWKKHGKLIGILFCVPAFILCGFEHSIADMFYLFNGRSFTLSALLFILIVIAGNGVGAVFFHSLLT